MNRTRYTVLVILLIVCTLAHVPAAIAASHELRATIKQFERRGSARRRSALSVNRAAATGRPRLTPAQNLLPPLTQIGFMTDHQISAGSNTFPLITLAGHL